MIKSYLKIAYRNLKRNRGYTFINIAGLAVGMACCLLLLQYVAHELSFDRFHEKAERVYRVAWHMPEQDWAITPLPMGPILEDVFPDVEEVVRYTGTGHVLVERGERRFYEEHFAYADAAFFEVFDFTVLQGDPEAALARPLTVFLSEAMAERYFGDEDPVGKLLQVDKEHTYEVAGIFENVPANSHIQFDFLSGIETLYAAGLERDNRSRAGYTYVLLEDSQTGPLLEQQLANFSEKYAHDSRLTTGTHYSLTPLTDIHLYANLDAEGIPQNDIRRVMLFAAVALLILLIACINYMNLSTAQSIRRAREVGVRKAAGATRPQLMRQFLGESVLLSIAALGAALLLVNVLRPWFNEVMQVPLAPITAGWLLPALAGAALVVGVLAGTYPAVYLSAFRPARVLKGLTAVHGFRHGGMRQGLVVFQFGIAVVLIIVTLVLQGQMNFIQQHRPGFDSEHVVMLPVRDGALEENYAAFHAELMRHGQIEQVARSSFTAGTAGAIHMLSAENIEGVTGDDPFVVDGFTVDEHFVETIGLEIIAGRDFSRARSTDSATALLVNQSAVEAFGWKEAIGKTIDLFEEDRTVVGVVADFQPRSLREEIRPAVFYPGLYTRSVGIRINPGDPGSNPGQALPETLAYVEAQWSSFVPEQPFVYSFLEEDFDALYRKETRLTRLFMAATLLVLLVACLGLFGLSAFAVERRTREIGIRKVLGASVTGLVALLSKDFLKLVAIGFIIAAPVAYYVMQKWLENFAYRIELGIGIFALAGLLAVLIAMATVSYQAVRAALADPVKALRSE